MCHAIIFYSLNDVGVDDFSSTTEIVLMEQVIKLDDENFTNIHNSLWLCASIWKDGFLHSCFGLLCRRHIFALDDIRFG